MPFGLTNAPSVFQRLKDGVLVNCTEFSKVYIDDILVVSRNWEEHLGHLRELLETLREAGLTCKRSKCCFGRKTLEFLGHQIGGGTISVPAARVRVIKEPETKDPEAASCFPGVGGVLSAFHCGLPPVIVVSDTPYVCGED